MASSALYRYFKSRDELLTRLIIDAYDALGAAAEVAEATVDRNDLAGRFAATCTAVRAWSLAHPNEYALIYGSPVPGYPAPAATLRPPRRVPPRLLRPHPRRPARRVTAVPARAPGGAAPRGPIPARGHQGRGAPAGGGCPRSDP